MTTSIQVGRGIALLAGISLGLLTPAHAQTVEGQNEPQTATEALLEEIVVTARKKGSAESVQNVPIAVTAFGQAQLEAGFVRDLQGVSYSIPNVQLDDVGTTPGYANFSIRGLGINSSIPSIDPTVGVFVDGVYLGINAGVVFDNFDLEGIEILRGPQGLLFGRNVTGGAVVVRTTVPGDELRVNARASVETGLNKTISASVSGPVTDSVAVKLAGYYSDDDGWFTNLFDESEFGRSEQWIVRPAIALRPRDGFEMILRFEHGEARGDGPPAQNRAIFDRQTFDFAINYPGFYDNRTDMAVVEVNGDVGFGNGLITNIAGFRRFRSRSGGDVDSTTSTLFEYNLLTDQTQLSNELRYTGRFGDFDVTTGLYYFVQDLLYIERRFLSAGRVVDGGGQQTQSTWGVFASADWAFTPTLTLNLGLRYSEERKDADVSTLRPGGCDLAAERCAFNFFDKDKWTDWTPKVGLQWRPDADVQIYAFWARGFRSGGYNFRNTDPAVPPGPFDQERQDSFEVGGKFSFAGGARLNLAAFHNSVGDLQREINLPGPLGVSQVIRNTADATIRGLEAEGRIELLPGLVVNGQVGYTAGEYDRVRFDLSGDGVVTDADLALKLPRLSPWTYGIGATYDQQLGDAATATLRVDFNHRDRAAYTDNNRGTLNAADILDASLSISTPDQRWRLSVYGKNMLNDVTEGGDTQLPAAFGGVGASFSPLNKGRIVGVELQYRM